MSRKEELRRLLRGDVKDDHETSHHYSGDAIAIRLTPEVVVFPKNSEYLNGLANNVWEKEGRMTGLSAVTYVHACMNNVPGALVSPH